MMKKFWVSSLVLLISLLSACAMTPEYAKDIEYASETDPTVKMDGFKSYAWLAAAAIVNDSEGRWEPPALDVDSEIKFLADANLRNKGLTEDSANPELLAVFTIGLDMDALKTIKLDEASEGMIKNVPQSALVLMLVNAQTLVPVWIGAAKAEVKNGLSEETVKARLKYAIDGMFETM